MNTFINHLHRITFKQINRFAAVAGTTVKIIIILIFTRVSKVIKKILIRFNVLSRVKQSFSVLDPFYWAVIEAYVFAAELTGNDPDNEKLLPGNTMFEEESYQSHHHV